MDFKIFVSYSSHDLKQVYLLKQQLENTPLTVFVAEHSIMPGQELEPTISKAVDECDLFIVLWSKNAKDSDWVSQEIGHARALKKEILPLVLTEGMSLPGFINNLKYLPVYEETQKALSVAREIAVSAYNKKLQTNRQLEEDRQKQKARELVFIGIGVFMFWAFSQK
jgi:hypothetical protein